MNTKNLVRPIRSAQRFRLSESGLPAGRIGAADRLEEMLKPGDGNTRRCATNVVVYGGHSPAADEFAAAALACLQPNDSLWRVGTGEASDSRVIWISEDHQLLSMLNARAVFIPADEQHQYAVREWQDRTGGIFVGPGPREEWFAAIPGNIWPWVDTAKKPPPDWESWLPASFIHPGALITVAQGRVQPLEVGDAFSDLRFDCWSEDRRVRASVSGGRGGELNIAFIATDPALAGARIRFQFRTSAGGTLQGERQLWPDEGNTTQLVAFWQGNQLDFERPQGQQPDALGEAVRLMFAFEVLPSEPPPQL